MKKILMMMVVFGVFVIVPADTEAAPLCNNNRTPNLQIEDPACYITRTTSRTESYTYTDYITKTSRVYCRWNCSRPLYICVNSSGRQYFATSTSGRRGCGLYSKICYNNCGGSACLNRPPRDYWGTVRRTVPVTRTGYRTVSSTSRTCYYTTVTAWSSCSSSGIQSATSVRQHSVSGTSCQSRQAATTRTCPACGSANGVPTGIAPSSGLCVASNSASSPSLSGTNWNWTCTASTGSVNCSAPNEEAGECSSVYQNQTIEAPGLNGSEELCTGGTVSNFNAVTSTGPWTWDCDPIGANAENGYITENCNANCFDFAINVNPNPFPWPTTGDPATVNIGLTRMGQCQGLYSCTTDNKTIPITGTVSASIDQGVDAFTIPVECIRTGDGDGDGNRDDACVSASCPGDGDIVKHDQNVSGYCIARECNVQGTCQSRPVQSKAYNSAACTSLCNSTADCSSGRVIETQP